MASQESSIDPRLRKKKTTPTSTTQLVAIVVLTAYIGFSAVFFVASLSLDTGTEKNWYDLTKVGFTTLGSALTLILGYYFGQKQAADFTELKAAQEEQMQSILKDEVDKRAKLMDVLNTSPSQSQPDDLARANLPKRKE